MERSDPYGKSPVPYSAPACGADCRSSGSNKEFKRSLYWSGEADFCFAGSNKDFNHALY